MSKPIQMLNKNSAPELKKALKATKDEGQKTRLRILLAVKKKKKRKEIAEDLQIHNDTIADTIRKYNSEGIVGLKTNKGGRPEGNPKWDRRIFAKLTKQIDKQGQYWSIPLMVIWIKEEQNQSIPYNTVWNHMRNLNYSYKSARPHPYLGNTAKQEEFKKKD
jgi:transposase